MIILPFYSLTDRGSENRWVFSWSLMWYMELEKEVLVWELGPI